MFKKREWELHQKYFIYGFKKIENEIFTVTLEKKIDFVENESWDDYFHYKVISIKVLIVFKRKGFWLRWWEGNWLKMIQV